MAGFPRPSLKAQFPFLRSPTFCKPSLSHRLLGRSFEAPCPWTYNGTRSAKQLARSLRCIEPHRSSSRKQPIESLPSSCANGSKQDELAAALSVLESSSVPQEKAVHEALRQCEHVAKAFSVGSESYGEQDRPNRTSTSNLLTRKDSLSTQAVSSYSWTGNPSKDDVLQIAYQLVTDEKTFLTSNILRAYVSIASILGRPQSLPDIFNLYASKPVPQAGSAPIIYRESNPLSHKAAIPLDIAQTALKAAIDSRDLPLCLSIVTTSVATRAFRRNKVLHKVSMPAMALACTPWASHKLATIYTEWSPRSDPDYAFYLSYLAFMTFFSMTAITMYVGVTIQFSKVRVTWRAGTALYERWTREEERAFIDEIAQGWGFQDALKRGEEEGREWSELREWIMDRSMELDRPDWMEGME